MIFNEGVIIALDFDGTLVYHRYPLVGETIPHSLDVLHWLQKNGATFVLNTMRSGGRLNEAVKYCEANGIDLYGVNENPTQKEWTNSPKVYANIYIDDAALGCPVKYDSIGRKYVDWLVVKDYFKN